MGSDPPLMFWIPTLAESPQGIGTKWCKSPTALAQLKAHHHLDIKVKGASL